RGELVVPREPAETEQHRSENGDRQHLIHDQRNSHQKVADDGADGRLVLEEIIDAIGEVGDQVDDDERDEAQSDDAQEFAHEIAEQNLRDRTASFGVHDPPSFRSASVSIATAFVHSSCKRSNWRIGASRAALMNRKLPSPKKRRFGDQSPSAADTYPFSATVCPTVRGM